ncbi:MAG: hypothetical protein J0I25_07085 [Sphingomonadales bacterium]|nr:hypothetical protein [Sphingomonadales bacterium]
MIRPADGVAARPVDDLASQLDDPAGRLGDLEQCLDVAWDRLIAAAPAQQRLARRGPALHERMDILIVEPEQLVLQAETKER